MDLRHVITDGPLCEALRQRTYASLARHAICCRDCRLERLLIGQAACAVGRKLLQNYIVQDAHERLRASPAA